MAYHYVYVWKYRCNVILNHFPNTITGTYRGIRYFNNDYILFPPLNTIIYYDDIWILDLAKQKKTLFYNLDVYVKKDSLIISMLLKSIL